MESPKTAEWLHQGVQILLDDISLQIQSAITNPNLPEQFNHQLESYISSFREKLATANLEKFIFKSFPTIELQSFPVPNWIQNKATNYPWISELFSFKTGKLWDTKCLEQALALSSTTAKNLEIIPNQNFDDFQPKNFVTRQLALEPYSCELYTSQIKRSSKFIFMNNESFVVQEDYVNYEFPYCDEEHTFYRFRKLHVFRNPENSPFEN